MSITRTAQTDDDGSGTTGAIWNNAWKTELYDQIDAAIATGTIQTTTSTGTQNDFALTGKASTLRCNNASLLTLTGLAAGYSGQRVWIESVGAGQVDLANQNTGSAAANRIANQVTATISLAAGLGRALVEYDATAARWLVLIHEQGAWITPAFNAGDFTASSGNWTLTSGDRLLFAYWLRGRQLSLLINLQTTTVSATPAHLDVLIPGGFSYSGASALIRSFIGSDNGTYGQYYMQISGTTLQFYHSIGATGTWATATDTTAVFCDVTFAVA